MPSGASQVLLAAEGVDLEFSTEALHEMTRVAEEVNRTLDNIGARRLHAVLERVVEEVSFSAPELVAAARREQQQVQAQQQPEPQTEQASGDGSATRPAADAEAKGPEAAGAAAAAGPSGGGGEAGKGTDGKGGPPARVKYVIDRAHVERTLSSLLQKQDLTRYIL
jgi:hypothetical protein